MSRPPKYGLEFALNKVFREVRELVIAMKKFFFRIPKTKQGTVIYLVTVSPWVLLMIAIILRI